MADKVFWVWIKESYILSLPQPHQSWAVETCRGAKERASILWPRYRTLSYQCQLVVLLIRHRNLGLVRNHRCHLSLTWVFLSEAHRSQPDPVLSVQVASTPCPLSQALRPWRPPTYHITHPNRHRHRDHSTHTVSSQTTLQAPHPKDNHLVAEIWANPWSQLQPGLN